MISDVRAINSSEQVVGLLMPNGPRAKKDLSFHNNTFGLADPNEFSPSSRKRVGAIAHIPLRLPHKGGHCNEDTLPGEVIAV